VPTWILSVLSPFTHAVAAVLATAHHALVAAGADPASGLTWVAALVALVVVVRLALIPLVVRQVRLAHATARAQPALAAISTAYVGRTDPDSLRRRLEETRAVQAEHGVGAFAVAAPAAPGPGAAGPGPSARRPRRRRRGAWRRSRAELVGARGALGRGCTTRL